jgi:hypothetical protein
MLTNIGTTFQCLDEKKTQQLRDRNKATELLYQGTVTNPTGR